MGHDAESVDVEAFLSAHEPVAIQAAFSAGEMFGDWRVTAFLGRGGSGEVYRAVHTTLGTEAALKVCVAKPERDVFRDEAVCARFRREAELLAKNVHPSFPRFLGFGERDGRPWYAMELLEDRPLPAVDGDVARFVLAVAAGVGYLHSIGLVHRDIKPGNILWRKGGRPSSAVAEPVLIDLGLVKDVSAVRGHSGESLSIVDGRAVGVGTPRYAAPEQMDGGEVTPATDVYALGMLANDCFDDKPPRSWRHVIQRATAAVPQHRYQTVAAFARAIKCRHWVKWTMSLAVFVMIGVACVFLRRPSVTVVAETDVKPVAVSETNAPSAYRFDQKVPPRDIPGDNEVWNGLGERIRTNRIERIIVWSTRQLGRGKALERDKMHPSAKEFFDAKFPGKTTWDAGMPSYYAVFVTNKVDVIRVDLAGRRVVFDKPVHLSPEMEYWITGPGLLDADVSGPTNSVLRLKNCVLINRTNDYYPRNGIYYLLENGVYLNFINIKQEPVHIRRRDVMRVEDGAFNKVRFGGPETIEGLNDAIFNERMKSVE